MRGNVLNYQEMGFDTVVGTAIYKPVESVLRIKAVIGEDGRSLLHKSLVGMETKANRRWRTDIGPPAVFISHYEIRSIRLYPIPDAVEHMTILGSRLPVVPMTALPDVPEIDPIYHYLLPEWAVFLATRSSDSEKANSAAAQDAAMKFESAFGPPITAVILRSRFERLFPSNTRRVNY